MTPDQLLREAVEVLKWIDVWGREANGDGRYYIVAFDSPAGQQLRHVVANARNEATHAEWDGHALAEKVSTASDNHEANEYARTFNRIAEMHGFDLPMELLAELIALFEVALSPSVDGNQQGSGLRGDPGAPRTVDGEARDKESSSSSLPPPVTPTEDQT